ncbi:REC8 meiotic recombination protein b [Denticeps clupeoides]|uniref:REC8 meiotic recombination protein b n=1 Tax=Denticeps clupeoides TaxID=299321 RepID=UPI0010A31D50|nr:meiotic recombination protein REC8 homolog [Denticeps clupeoides]
MFYYPYVLRRHSGCFSTIWLAATKGVKVTRREVLKVNIGRTCEDIMDYVTVKVSPLHPSLPRPRFSLYLSSQLQYGVVLVYHRQCVFLLEETQQTIEKLLRTERHFHIDMQEPDRLALNYPNALTLLEEAEGALEPFFGVMGVELPRPCELTWPWQFLEAPTPQCPPVTTPKMSQPEAVGLAASPECITLKEEELVAIPVADFGGAELPEATAQEIDMLLEQRDPFVEDEKRTGKTHILFKDSTSMVVYWHLECAITLKTPSAPKSRVESVVKDGGWRSDEETGRPVEVAMETTPPPMTLPTTTETSEVDRVIERVAEQDLEQPFTQPKAPVHRRSRRRLIFADQHIQISQDEMQERVQNTTVNTQSLANAHCGVPPTRGFSAAGMFSAPCCLLIHPRLQSLWQQGAVVLPILHADASNGEEEEEVGSEPRVERSVEEKEIARRARESSLKEIPRESSESGFTLSEASAASEVLLDVSKEDKPQDLILPTRWSPSEDTRFHMEAILEEPGVDLPEREPESDMKDLTSESLLRYHMLYGKVTFESVLPPEADRRTAAHMFYNLLEVICLREITVYQAEPYEPIIIRPGPLHADT